MRIGIIGAMNERGNRIKNIMTDIQVGNGIFSASLREIF